MMGKGPVLFALAAAVVLVLAALFSVRRDREAGRGNAAPRPDSRNDPVDLDAWLREALAFYRNLGFMPEHEGKSDDEVFETVKARLERDWGDSLAGADGASLELFLAESMPSRIWWRDTEADVFMDNHVYEEVLGEWARISNGAFQPENITEHWDSEQGPLRITFDLDGQPRELHPAVQDDWLDMNIVAEINRMIESTGRRFAMHVPDQTAVLMCVTPDERRRLENERGWSFVQ